MKRMTFKTIAGKTHVIKFSEEDFLSYMEHCYNHLPMKVEIALFINNLHSDKINKMQVFDSCDPNTIRCNYSNRLLKFFELQEQASRFNL